MRFFFDINDGERNTRDEVGLDLPDRNAARLAAVDVLPDIARDELPDGDRRSFVCRVRDSADSFIFEARLELIAEWIGTAENDSA